MQKNYARDYLELRRILPETIQAHQLEFDNSPTAERIIARLGEDIQVAGKLLSKHATELLWFPHLNSDGATTSWTVRIFPTPPDGPKFLTPKGGGGPPYIPPAAWLIADKAEAPIILTEGCTKALATTQIGYPAIGLNGVFGAGSRRDADDNIILHPLLSTFSWAKRFVLLAFDADILTKFDVRKGLFRTFLLLVAQQADVCTITSWDADQGKGIDDFLAKSEDTAAELELLIKDRTPFLSILEKSPSDLRLAEEELRTVVLPRLQRAQVVRQVAKTVGVTYKDLLDSISRVTPEAGANRELNLVDQTTPWDGLVDGEELLKEIYEFIGRVVWMTDAARMTVSFWLIASFTFKAFRRFPYLRIKSPDRNCGKSTLVDFLNELVFKPVVAVDVTPAGLYRAAEQFQPTILLDEFDNAEQIKELTQLLNAGYDANRVAIRFNNEKGVLEQFRTFCPKVIASIRRLAETTESRCLPIDMQRIPADAEKNLVELCDIDPARFLTIKRKILAWVEDNCGKISNTRPTRPDWLKTRDWDVWRSSFAIAEVIGGNAPNLVKSAAIGLFADRVVEQSLAIEILGHLRDAAKQSSVFIEPKKGKRFLPSEKVIDYCNGDLEASWANWKSGKAEGLTVERLARELREHFKVRSKRIGYQNKDVRGYWLKDLQRHFNSFLPPEDEPPTDESESREKEDSQNPSEKGSQPGGITATPSESATSLRHVDENNLADRHVEKSNLSELSDTPSIGYENSARFGPQFSPSAETLFLAIDVETSAELEGRRGGKVSRDAVDPHKAELRIISIADPNGNVLVHDCRTGPLPDYLRAAIATTPLVGHGLAFDTAVLQANGYATCENVFCTLTASRLLTAGLRDSNDLGTVLKCHLGLEIPKELGASDWGGIFLTDQQLEYCRNDVLHLHRLREVLQAKLASPGDEHGDGAEGVDLVRVARLEMSLIPLVVDIRLRGIMVDRATLKQTLKAYETRKKQLAAELRVDLQAPRLNFASPEQLLRALKMLGIEIPNTSKETLSSVVGPIAGQILRYRELAGLCTTLKGWLEGLDGDNRLYPPLNPLGAATGRFSCQKPNLLAVPRNSEVRSCFIPDSPELTFIEADFANIEMRIAAWLTQESRMLEIFRNGGDIHGETAERVLHDLQARQSAKPINFGCLYGGGAERLRITARTEFGIEFTPEEAKQYHGQFFSAYPNLRRWHGAARDSSSELTYGTTAYGRRRWANPEDPAHQRDWNRFQLATNFEVQGAGADALKIALANIGRQLANTPTRIILPLHDAILVQTPRENAQAVAEILSQTMRGAFYKILGADFPVAVDARISERWGEGK